MTEKLEAKVTHRFAASPERVYDAFVNPEIVRAWQESWARLSGTRGKITACEIDPRVGGKFLFADMRDGEEARHWGTFLELERPTKVSFTWIVDPSEEADPSVVTVIIEPEPDGAGSIVTLYNTMDAEWAEYLPQTEKAWRSMLMGIEDALSSR